RRRARRDDRVGAGRQGGFMIETGADETQREQAHDQRHDDADRPGEGAAQSRPQTSHGRYLGRPEAKATVRPAQPEAGGRPRTVPAPGDGGTVTPVAQLLLVEDDAEIRRGLMRGLAELGHAVVGVASGYEALKEIVDQRPDLVVLDLGLPDIDGGELLRMVRA